MFPPQKHINRRLIEALLAHMDEQVTHVLRVAVSWIKVLPRLFSVLDNAIKL